VPDEGGVVLWLQTDVDFTMQLCFAFMCCYRFTAISGCRDDFSHTHINDIGLVAVTDPETGAVGFNVVVGGFFSIKVSLYIYVYSIIAVTVRVPHVNSTSICCTE
jgi:Nitrite and sulphite reductase 4Fe-4S domain